MRRPSVPTAEGREALAEARMITDLIRDGRESVHLLADRRRRAVLKANRCGASYKTIASELQVSPAHVQQLVNAAKAREADA